MLTSEFVRLTFYFPLTFLPSLGSSYNRPFCDKCQKYKPERTHHCKVCDMYVEDQKIEIGKMAQSIFKN